MAATMPLVVGVDGSEPNLEAVGWAAREAALHTMPLHLVHAAAPGQDASGPVTAASERAAEVAPGLRLSSDVPRDDAVSALVGEGRRGLVLVVGARGRGELPGLLLGSVGLAVAARVDCPVVVVRGSQEHQNGRFGRIVVGVEDGAESDTAVEYALREAHVRRCELIAVHAWSSPLGAPPNLRPGRGTPLRPTIARPRRCSTTPCATPRSGTRTPRCRGGWSRGRRSAHCWKQRRKRICDRRCRATAGPSRTAARSDQPCATASRTVSGHGRATEVSSARPEAAPRAVAKA